MYAKEFMAYVAECRAERWQNSDISSGGERLFEIVADHFQVCEECRNAFDTEEYEEKTLLDFWHRYMAQREDPMEWICDEGLQILFDHPIDIFLVTIENSSPAEWRIEMSEMAAKHYLRSRFPGVDLTNEFESCEEPEAIENEYVMIALLENLPVARIYTEVGA